MKILILGAGAIGSNLASLLACDLRGEHELTILDYDTVEERNVRAGTQLYVREQIGLPKVEALQYNIYKWFGKKVDIVNKKLTDETDALMEGYNLIIDCFDNYEARNLVAIKWDFSKDGTFDILHIGFSDKMTFAIEWAENYQVPSDITTGLDICEMQGAASFIKYVAGIASNVVQEYTTNKRKLEFVGSKYSFTEIK